MINHFKLTFRLLFDRRVSLWLKLFTFLPPLAYLAFPTPDDIVPILWILDDALVFAAFSWLFVRMAPGDVLNEQRARVQGMMPSEAMRQLNAMRYPDESKHFAIGVGITLAILTVGGYLVGLVGALVFGLVYLGTLISRGGLMGNAVRVTEKHLPDLYQILQAAQANLPPVKVNLFVTQNPALNAFAFGHNEPYTIVLTSALVERLTPIELQAVIGHEMGHILFEHVRLTSFMAGAPGLLQLLFYQWSRSCEYSCDAAALVSVGNDPRPVCSVMLKLASGLSTDRLDVDAFMEQFDESSEILSGEWLQTHPMLVKRVKRIRQLVQGTTGNFQPAAAPVAA
ncbi:MAG: hypothetical protein OHK0052_06950 [Anaerolineales bacterium]